jgi:hypothetical protein
MVRRPRPHHSTLEAAGIGLKPRQIEKLLAHEDVGADLVAAAGTIKALAGQVNTLMHAAGILVSLPYILEPGEVVESLSLGAGDTGRDHDLVTDRQIAEFKFIDWRPSRNTLRGFAVHADACFLTTPAGHRHRALTLALGSDGLLAMLVKGRTEGLEDAVVHRQRVAELGSREETIPRVPECLLTQRPVFNQELQHAAYQDPGIALGGRQLKRRDVPEEGSEAVSDVLTARFVSQCVDQLVDPHRWV